MANTALRYSVLLSLSTKKCQPDNSIGVYGAYRVNRLAQGQLVLLQCVALGYKTQWVDIGSGRPVSRM